MSNKKGKTREKDSPIPEDPYFGKEPEKGKDRTGQKEAPVEGTVDETDLLREKLDLAKKLLEPELDRARKIVLFFSVEELGTMASPDRLLARFKPLLENAPRESYRVCAQVIAEMGGSATFSQIHASTTYGTSTVAASLGWLKRHQVLKQEGKGHYYIDGAQ